VRKPLGLFAPL